MGFFFVFFRRVFLSFLAGHDDWRMSRFQFPKAVLLETCPELKPDLEISLFGLYPASIVSLWIKESAKLINII